MKERKNAFKLNGKKSTEFTPEKRSIRLSEIIYYYLFV